MAPTLENHTPFSALAFSQFHRDGTDMAVLSVRGTFHLVPDAPLVLAPRQDEVELADRYEGDPAQGLLVRTCDLVPFKPAADLTILGTSWAPRGAEAASWITGVRLGRLEKVVRVHGPRVWRPVPPEAEGRAGTATTTTTVTATGKDSAPPAKDWTLTPARPARAVSLGWQQAFGGPIPGTGGDDGAGGKAPVDVHRFNPIGCGIVDAEHSATDADIAAPAIEDPHDPVCDWRRRDHQPQGFAPVPPVWRFRQQYTGTFDDAWLAQKHPLLPDDFDYRFYQYAPPGLVHAQRLDGDEELQLLHMHPDHSHIQVWLPGVQPVVTPRWKDGSTAAEALMLDGVHVDLHAPLATVHLTWRCWVPKRAGLHGFELRLDDPGRLLEVGRRYVKHARVTGAPFPAA